jgi:hypothetical protein
MRRAGSGSNMDALLHSSVNDQLLDTSEHSSSHPIQIEGSTVGSNNKGSGSSQPPPRQLCSHPQQKCASPLSPTPVNKHTHTMLGSSSLCKKGPLYTWLCADANARESKAGIKLGGLHQGIQGWESSAVEAVFDQIWALPHWEDLQPTEPNLHCSMPSPSHDWNNSKKKASFAMLVSNLKRIYSDAADHAGEFYYRSWQVRSSRVRVWTCRGSSI